MVGNISSNNNKFALKIRILVDLFTILHGQYQPTQLYLRVGFSSSSLAPFFFICARDSAGKAWLLHFFSKYNQLTVSKLLMVNERKTNFKQISL